MKCISRMTPNRLRNTLEIKGRHFDTPSLRGAITAPLGMCWYVYVSVYVYVYMFFIHTSMIILYCARSHRTSRPLLSMPPGHPCDVAHRREPPVERPVRRWVPCVSWEAFQQHADFTRTVGGWVTLTGIMVFIWEIIPKRPNYSGS